MGGELIRCMTTQSRAYIVSGDSTEMWSEGNRSLIMPLLRQVQTAGAVMWH